MSKTVFLYPGQGAQKAGMGKDFYENSAHVREIYDRASDALGLDLKALCFEEDERLDLTEYTQAAMVTTCLAMTRVAEEAGLCADAAAGLSLGEYAAVAAAGGMSDFDAICLVRKRGILMQNTVPAGEGAMCAVMALETEKIEQVLETIGDVSIANYNCPGQIVITGKKSAVEQAAEQLKAAGARRTVMLKVSGPFHSQMLQPAGEALSQELEPIALAPLKFPYITNVGAREISKTDEIKTLLAQQVSTPVYWMQSMEYLIAQGADLFVEVGPGKTLAGFMKKIDRSVKVLNIEKWEDVEKTVQAIAEAKEA